MKIDLVDIETAERYVECLIGDNDLSPLANDELRRTLHDRIAKTLDVSTGLVKRAAWIVEHLAYDVSDVFGDYKDKDFLVKCFKKHLDEIYESKIQDRYDTSALIAGWTYDALHPEALRFSRCS